MKTNFIIILCLICNTLLAQTAINRTVAYQKGQKIRMHFDYPELINVSTWDKNEISIQGSVSINNGENDDAFVLSINTSGNEIFITNEIRDMKGLPHRITISRDGQKITFKNKSEWKKYESEHGGGHYNMSEGVEMEILLDIHIPRNIETTVESVYGMVEIKDFTGPLTVEATYGGVDASISERTTGELIAETNYGHIYSDLNLKFSSQNVRDENFHTLVSVKPGSGPRYSFESKYGNVYLRRKD